MNYKKILFTVALLSVVSIFCIQMVEMDADYNDEVWYEDGYGQTKYYTQNITNVFCKDIYIEWTYGSYTSSPSISSSNLSEFGLTLETIRNGSTNYTLKVSGTPTKTGPATFKSSYLGTGGIHNITTFNLTVNSPNHIVTLHSGPFDMSDITDSVRFKGTQHTVADGTASGDHVIQIDLANNSPITLPTVNLNSSWRMDGWFTVPEYGTSVGSQGSIYTPPSNISNLYAHYSTNTLRIDGFVDGNNTYHLFTMNHNRSFSSPVAFKTTPQADRIEVQTDNMSTQLEFVNGYLVTKSGTVVTDEAGPHSFTVVAYKDGYESVSQTYTVHIRIYSISVNSQSVVEGQTAYLQVDFSPNKTSLPDLSTDTVTITATWIKPNGSSEVFTATNANLTSTGAKIPIPTQDTQSNEVRYMSFYIRVEFKGSYADFGSYQPTTTYQVIVTPSSTIDMNAEPTVSYFTINKSLTGDNNYIATAVNPQNVHTYSWAWGDGDTDETTEPYCLHNYKDSNGQVTLTLTVGNLNGKTREYTNTVSLDNNGSYNAFVGQRWVSKLYPASATVNFSSGWPSVPTKYTTTNSANQSMQYYVLDIPQSLSTGQDLKFTVIYNGTSTEYSVGVFDASSVETGSDKIAVISSSGYNVKFGTTIPLNKILYDSEDHKNILWTAYNDRYVSGTVLGTSTELQPEFNFSGNARDVIVKLTVVQQDGNTYNYYKTVSVPSGTAIDDAPTDESKKVNITGISDMNIDIGVVESITLPYENVKVIYINDVEGLTLVLDGSDNATLTMLGSKKGTYKVVLVVEFNDNTWGRAEFNVNVQDESGWSTEGEPVERVVGISAESVSGPVGGDRIQVTIDARDVKLIDWKIKDSTKDESVMSVYLREGGDEFDWLRIVPYQVGTWVIEVTFTFENSDYGYADIIVTGTESSPGEETEYGTYNIADQTVESGMPIYIYLHNSVKVRAIEYFEDSDLQDMTLKLGEQGQILYLDKVDDGKYHVKVKLYFADNTQSIAEFNINVGSTPADDNGWTVTMAVAIVAILMAALIIIPRVI